MAKKTVLLVDDDEVFVDAVSAVLETKYRIRTASNGTEALKEIYDPELHYNIVAFDKTPEQMAKIQKGDALKGAFVIVADGLDSNSRFLLRGEFEIKKVKADRWTTKDLRAEKLEENGNSLCVLQ